MLSAGELRLATDYCLALDGYVGLHVFRLAAVPLRTVTLPVRGYLYRRQPTNLTARASVRGRWIFRSLCELPSPDGIASSASGSPIWT